jgi:hypothetical protein
MEDLLNDISAGIVEMMGCGPVRRSASQPTACGRLSSFLHELRFGLINQSTLVKHGDSNVIFLHQSFQYEVLMEAHNFLIMHQQ